MTVKKQKVVIEVEATTEGAVRGLDRVTDATEKSKKAVEKNDAALKKVKLEYEIAQARAKNYAETQAKAAKAAEEFGRATDRNRARLKEAQDAYNRHDTLLGKLSRKFQVDLAGGLMAVSSALNIGSTAFDMFAAGAAKVSELADRATTVNNVMGNLPFSIDKARQSTSGLVKDLDLATAASTLTSTGVVKTADEFAELAHAAQALGGRIGIDTPRAMESLTAALARGSTEMLDNLGIVLKVDQAHKEYAASMGKTVDALTDAEKAEAFREVAMRKIIEAARGVRVDTDSAGAAVKRFEADLDRLQNKALGGAEAQVSLKKGLEAVALSTGASSKNIATYGRDADALRDALRDLNVNTDDLAISNAKLGKELDKVRKEELGRIERMIFQGEATEENIRQLEFLRRALGDAGMVGATAVDAAIERQKEEALAARQARQALDQEHADLKLSIAFLQGKGEDQKLINAAIMEEMELRAKLLEGEGKSAEAARLRAEMEIAKARMEGEALRKRRGGGRRSPRGNDLGEAARRTEMEQWERMNALMAAKNEARYAKAQQLNPFSEENLTLQLENVIDFEERRAAVVLSKRQREIEAMRAAGADPIQLAEMETEAQIKLLEVQEAAAKRSYQREIDLAVLQGDSFAAAQLRADQEVAMVEFKDKIEAQYHSVAMLRIEEQRSAEEAAQAKRAQILTEASELYIGAAESVVQASIIQGAGLRATIAATAKAEAMRHGLILAPGEMIRGVISLAAQDYPGAAAHFAAGAKSFAYAGSMAAIAGAAGGFGGSRTASATGGFGAEAFGAGPGGSGMGSRSAGPGGGGFNMGGQVPLSQETKSKVSASAATSSGGGPMVFNQTNNINTTGTIDDMTARKLAQAIERSGQRQGKLAAGGRF